MNRETAEGRKDEPDVKGDHSKEVKGQNDWLREYVKIRAVKGGATVGRFFIVLVSRSGGSRCSGGSSRSTSASSGLLLAIDPAHVSDVRLHADGDETEKANR